MYISPKEIKYLHFFPLEKFTSSYIKMVNDNFNYNEHLFIITGMVDKSDKLIYKNYDNIVFFDECGLLEKRTLLHRYSKTSKAIFLHSLLLPKIIIGYFTLKSPLLKKAHWILWGGDLYYKNKYPKEFFRKFIIKNVGYISTYVRGDYDLAREWHNTNAKFEYILYPYLIDEKLINDVNEVAIEKEQYLTIQAGNSADPSNDHINIFDMISKYGKKI